MNAIPPPPRVAVARPAQAAVDRESPLLRVWLLGAFRVTFGAQTIGEAAWRLRKAKSLVKLLALAPGHRLEREQIMDLLWPDLDPVAAANNFHQALHAARRALDLGSASPSANAILRLQRQSLTLAPAGTLWVDVAAFEAAAATARRARDPAAYYAALELYPGDLLPEDRYADWATSRREALRETSLTLLLDLARVEEARGDHPAALTAFGRVLEREPAHEEAHVGLMRLLALTGQRHQALRQFARLRDALRRDLGVEPEPASQRLYQAILARQFPPPATPAPASTSDRAPAGARLHNLPVPLTSFVGRSSELAEARRLLARPTTRLLTLTGAGGCGKSRLALALARLLVAEGEYPDGVWLVELTALADPALAPQAVATALGVREEPRRPLSATLGDVLRVRTTLLLLDNCEHLAGACAALAQTLLAGCPGLRLLVTSRVVLHVPGEVVWRVPALTLPDPPTPARRSGVSDLVRSEAAQLFIERATTALPAFTVTDRNAEAVAEICRRLDGIPLAIELAAARAPVLPVEQLAARLDDALRLLTDGSRTLPPHQRTLRATLDWSHALLDAGERALLRRLAVFAGGWTLAAAEAVCAGPLAGESGVAGAEVLPLLARLVDQSLVLAEVREGEARYRFLETVRQYAWQYLVASGEAVSFQQHHAAHYLALAEEAAPKLQGAEQVAWLARLAREHDNLRVALRWFEHQGDVERGLRLAVALWRFWEKRGHLREGRAWFAVALGGTAAGRDVAPAVRAAALDGAGTLAWQQSDYELASALFAESLALYRDLDDRHGIARALGDLGTVAQLRGDVTAARALYEESVALQRALGNRWGVALTLNNLALVADRQGDATVAETYLQECLALCRDLDDTVGIASALDNLSELACARGDYPAARARAEEARVLFEELGDRRGIAGTFANLSQVARLQGDYEQARACAGQALALYAELGFQRGVAGTLATLGLIAADQGESEEAQALAAQALTIRRALGNRLDIAESLASVAGLLAARGQHARAARLLSATQGLCEASQASLLPIGRRAYERTLAAVRAALRPDDFATAWAAGGALDLDAAIAEALRGSTNG